MSSIVMKGFFIAFFVFVGQSTYAQLYKYEYDIKIRSIYQDIVNLKLKKAKNEIKDYSIVNSHNLAAVHMLSYVDFFSLFINENEQLYHSLEGNKETYLTAVRKGPASSEYKRFVEAEILLQWALIDLKFDHKLSAGKAIYNAYKLLEANKEEFPLFELNNKSLSIIHSLAASLPKWVRNLFGIEGDIQLGYREISKLKKVALTNRNQLFREEIAAINSYILFYQLNNQKQAIADLKSFKLDYKSSPLLSFLEASMALRSGDNDGCLSYLLAAPKGKDYAEFHYLDFMTGRSYLYQLDSRAEAYLQAYVNNFGGKHYIKEAYQKLAWYSLAIKEDTDKYHYYINKCYIEGDDLVDEDKQALKEAESDILPNKELLKSRLLFDGGYYLRAYKLLRRLNNQGLSDSELIELEYRKGRCLQQLGRTDEAINAFLIVLSMPQLSDYRICSSALQLGLLYEGLGQKSKASQFFQKALDLKPAEYQNSLHQKAKSGLQRMNK